MVITRKKIVHSSQIVLFDLTSSNSCTKSNGSHKYRRKKLTWNPSRIYSYMLYKGSHLCDGWFFLSHVFNIHSTRHWLYSRNEGFCSGNFRLHIFSCHFNMNTWIPHTQLAMLKSENWIESKLLSAFPLVCASLLAAVEAKIGYLKTMDSYEWNAVHQFQLRCDFERKLFWNIFLLALRWNHVGIAYAFSQLGAAEQMFTSPRLH